MFNMNTKLTEQLALVAVIDPATTANTERFSNVIDMSRFHQVIAAVLLGNMASEAIDARFYACDSDGSNGTIVLPATQLGASASANDGTQLLFSLRAEALLASGKRYARLGVVTGGATGGPVAAAVFGQVRQGAAVDQDLSTVSQVL